MDDLSALSQELLGLEDVTRVWFEWESVGAAFKKTVVVEINCDTSAQASNHFKRVLESVSQAVAAVQEARTTMGVGGLRVVPTGYYRA